jgi:hypothetical protein
MTTPIAIQFTQSDRAHWDDTTILWIPITRCAGSANAVAQSLAGKDTAIKGVIFLEREDQALFIVEMLPTLEKPLETIVTLLRDADVGCQITRILDKDAVGPEVRMIHSAIVGATTVHFHGSFPSSSPLIPVLCATFVEKHSRAVATAATIPR